MVNHLQFFMLLPPPPILSEETPMYLSLFFLAFFLSSLSLSSSWTNSTISFTFWRTLMPWSFPFSSAQTQETNGQTYMTNCNLLLSSLTAIYNADAGLGMCNIHCKTVMQYAIAAVVCVCIWSCKWLLNCYCISLLQPEQSPKQFST